MEKVSEMLIAVGGDLLKTVDNREEMQAHLELVQDAWNLSLYSPNKRKTKLKMLMEAQRPYAPSEEAIKRLEWEYRRIMKQRDSLYPTIKKKVVYVEAIETAKNDYMLRAYFTDEYQSLT